ncbi:hypothetical protein TW95_gp1264 [Pandoravirus inopinatum]|uniref:Uncharacterized protein n=1 Tax=Pandoravirus inopinatum TaxID=1605721 RepID=A0A0B5IYN5_9VIRU|nr:hypothetical protein TW95_gp1264 [Pandoravirus inopinatum]AJF97998.1 hypothetical protein [Pandoravirus inopinatum]
MEKEKILWSFFFQVSSCDAVVRLKRRRRRWWAPGAKAILDGRPKKTEPFGAPRRKNRKRTQRGTKNTRRKRKRSFVPFGAFFCASFRDRRCSPTPFAQKKVGPRGRFERSHLLFFFPSTWRWLFF